jgi:Di-sulfide bridge nucleocytoplasmic transport domain
MLAGKSFMGKNVRLIRSLTVVCSLEVYTPCQLTARLQCSGTHNVFDSPAKPQPPASAFQNFSFSTPSAARPLPNAFQGNPSFTTPRKFDTEAFSSGAETPSSPYNAEAEGTPEAPTKGGTIRGITAMTPFTGAAPVEKSPQLLSKSSGRWWNVSPGRGEVRRGKFADTVGRVRKRPRVGGDRENRYNSRHDGYDSGNSSDDTIPLRYGRRGYSPDKKPSSASSHAIGSFFSWMEAHPGLPHVLISYFQLLWNIMIVFYILHLAYGFVSTIRADVTKKSNEAMADILVEIAACAQQFVDNKCDRGNRVPAMENVCNTWEKCMNRDPKEVGYAKVSAHTFAEIFNSLIEPISYKSMVCVTHR